MMTTVRRIAMRLGEWLTQEHWLVGASITRVSLGTWAVYYLVLHWPVRYTLYGPDGIWPFARFIQGVAFFNLFQLSPSDVYFELIYHLGIVAAVLYAVGIWSRVMGMIQWLMIWSLMERNPFLGDGGDNIMRIALLFLVLVNTGACFSVDESRRRKDSHPPSAFHQAREVVREFLRPSAAVIHNLGILLVVAQVCLMYVSTGLYKVMGEVWQNGTALYYILRVDEYSWPGIAEVVYRNQYLVVAGTYGTVFFELLFAPSLLYRYTRYLIMAAGFFFHLGIALFMGLITFGWSMLSYYPLLLTDTEYRSLVGWLKQRLGLRVFYDGWCPLCTRSIQWLGCLDLLSLVTFVSFRNPGVVETHGLDIGRAERRIQGVTSSGTVREGIDVTLQMAARIVLLWPLTPLLFLARVAAGQRAYDALASRRIVVTPGACQDHCAVGRSVAER